jgi:hypothetical protein
VSCVRRRPISETIEEVAFGPIVLGFIDETKPEKGLILKKKEKKKVSGMSSD